MFDVKVFLFIFHGDTSKQTNPTVLYLAFQCSNNACAFAPKINTPVSFQSQMTPGYIT